MQTHLADLHLKVPQLLFLQFLANMEIFSNTSSTIEEINREGTCNLTNDDALKQQYQSSFFCAYMVEDALINNECQSVPPFVPEKVKLCSKICDAARNSVSKTLSSCQAPRNITGGLDFFCSKSTSSDDSTCFSGIKSEVDFCGKILLFLITRIPYERSG